jgi:hypothetical protein
MYFSKEEKSREGAGGTGISEYGKLGSAFRDSSLKPLDFALSGARIAPTHGLPQGNEQFAKCVLRKLSAFF